MRMVDATCCVEGVEVSVAVQTSPNMSAAEFAADAFATAALEDPRFEVQCPLFVKVAEKAVLGKVLIQGLSNGQKIKVEARRSVGTTSSSMTRSSLPTESSLLESVSSVNLPTESSLLEGVSSANIVPTESSLLEPQSIIQPAAAFTASGLSFPGIRIEKLVVDSGQATVYVGIHESSRAKVAIKVMHLADPNARAAYREELETLMQLRHPNILRVVSTFEKPQGLMSWLT